jgi:hypothetical protein
VLCVPPHLPPHPCFNTASPSPQLRLESTLESASRIVRYNLFFANCAGAGTLASFDLHYEQFNPGPNFLSAGDVKLPWVYFGMSGVYALMAACWLALLLSSATENVKSVHYLMGVLVVLKTLSLFFEGIKFWQLAAAGKVDGGWNFLFYAFQSAR